LVICLKYRKATFRKEWGACSKERDDKRDAALRGQRCKWPGHQTPWLEIQRGLSTRYRAAWC
jgi:hypothetical protein